MDQVFKKQKQKKKKGDEERSEYQQRISVICDSGWLLRRTK